MPAKHVYRRNLPHIQTEFHTYFVTFVTQQRQILTPPERDVVLAHVVFDDQRVMNLHAAVVMPDHVHIVFTPWHVSLGKLLQGMKGSSSRSINKLRGVIGQHVWQHESFDHELRNGESLRAKCEYVAQNPLRRGLCATPDEYRWLWREWINRTET